MATRSAVTTRHRLCLAAVALSVPLAVGVRPAVAQTIPTTLDQGRAAILAKTRATDQRHRDITGHAVSNRHRT